jgi:hypothetical protein
MILPDGQFAHGRHAQIARRVNLSQADGVAEYPKSTSHSPRPVPTRGAFRDRHERWVRDAVDALATQDERR